MSSENCEARIAYRDIKQSKQRRVTNLYGDSIDRGEGFKEEVGVGERTLGCDSCEISEVFRTEGMGYAPYNETARQVKSFLLANCKKWKAAEEKYASITSLHHLYRPPNAEEFFPK